jgi:Alginate lyase
MDVSEHRDGNSMTQILVLVLATIFFGLLVLFYFHPKQVGAADQKMSNSAFDPKQVNLPFFWIDPFRNCDHDFKCTTNLTTGWNNNTSLQVSTKINKSNNNTWSSISGKEINVKPNENYDFVTHMKLNEFATESHIKLEGYNITSNKWSSLKTQCPAGTKGPLEWREFSCNITIPNGITKIRPILNAGWSSQPGKEAVTLFDDISLKKIYSNRTSYGNNSNNTTISTNTNMISNPDFLPMFSAKDQKISNSTKIKSQTQILPQTILLDPSILANVKQAINNNNININNNAILQDSLKQLLLQANSFMTKKPTSVVEKSQLPPSGDKHDYFSLSPYDWPDPSKPNGLPYIGRDGMVNPEVYSIPDKQNLNDMILWVRTLSIAYYFTDDPKYASKAGEFLRVWFLNDNTSMNPNLQYSETAPGKNNLLHPGIMDGYRLPDVIDSIRLIRHSSTWTSQDQQKMETWFNRYLDWLLNSEAGRQESKSLNNHGTGYNVQVSSITIFLNKTSIAKKIVQTSADELIVAQIEKDGRQPFELRRTNSLDYSVFNLNGLFKLASIGQHFGIDLWNHKTPKGAGLQKALDYLLPFADPIKMHSWPYRQLAPIKTTSFAHLLCQAIMHYPKSSQSYLDAYKSLVGPKYVSTNIDNLLYGCIS